MSFDDFLCGSMVDLGCVIDGGGSDFCENMRRLWFVLNIKCVEESMNKLDDASI